LPNRQERKSGSKTSKCSNYRPVLPHKRLSVKQKKMQKMKAKPLWSATRKGSLAKTDCRQESGQKPRKISRWGVTPGKPKSTNRRGEKGRARKNNKDFFSRQDCRTKGKSEKKQKTSKIKEKEFTCPGNARKKSKKGKRLTKT